jgi:hypothetical protein
MLVESRQMEGQPLPDLLVSEELCTKSRFISPRRGRMMVAHQFIAGLFSGVRSRGLREHYFLRKTYRECEEFT